MIQNKNCFAMQSPAERLMLIEEAATRLRLTALIVEKDFWVG